MIRHSGPSTALMTPQCFTGASGVMRNRTTSPGAAASTG